MFNSIEKYHLSVESQDPLVIDDISDSLENLNKQTIEIPNIAIIECISRLTLIEQNAILRADSYEYISESNFTLKEVMSEEEKLKIKEETGWSDEIVECIQNIKQYEILKNAGLKEVEINGRKCLIKENMNLDYTDADGISNRNRIERRLSPLDSSGHKLELHHLGQKTDSPLVELTVEEHRTGEYEDGKKNQSLWHDNAVETSVHHEGNTWAQERSAHWQSRLEQISGD